VPRRVDILGEMFTAVDFSATREIHFPCVYLMAHEEQPQSGVHRIHYAGQTHRLSERFAGHHRLDAALALGATHALVLVIESEADRRAFETLLRYEFRPPLNEEEAPTHMQAWRAAQHCGKAELASRARAAHLKGAVPMLPPWTRRLNPPKTGT
jgi:hypothetical protein